MIAQARHNGNRNVTLTFGYKRQLVEDLKRLIPHHYRDYDPASKASTVIQPYVHPAVDLLRWHFPDAIVTEPSASTGPTPIRAIDPHFSELHLLPSAPPELVESAYKCLARLHHPNHGGDPQRMVELNLAIERLRERAGRRSA